MKLAVLPERKESEILAATLAFLYSVRGFFERRNTGAARHGDRYVQFGEEGTPDITGILWPGIPFAVETKREGWRPSNAKERQRFLKQLDWLERWCLAGGVGVVSTGVQVVADWVRAARNNPGEASRAAITHIELWRKRVR